jgi:hypothetical protein
MIHYFYETSWKCFSFCSHFDRWPPKADETLNSFLHPSHLNKGRMVLVFSSYCSLLPFFLFSLNSKSLVSWLSCSGAWKKTGLLKTIYGWLSICRNISLYY